MKCLAAELPPIKIPACEKPPMLDGSLNDPVWDNAAKIKQLYQLGSDEPAPETAIRLMRDHAWLYICADCRNPRLGQAEQMVYNDEGSVSQDDSLEILLRTTAGVDDPYCHFLISCYGVRADQICDAAGMRDRAWNAPWRASVSRGEDGWTAEIAIPLCALESDDLSALSINIGRNYMDVGLDPAGAITSQKIVHHTLRPDNRGGYHNLANFLPLSGLAGFQPEIPFAPVVAGADITGIVQENGKMFYELALVLDIATPAPGKAILKIIEDFGEGEVVAFSQPVELNGMLELQPRVALGDFRQRTVKIVLADSLTGNLLADRMVNDTSRLSVIRRAFAGRSYYTTEEYAEVRAELSLPDSMLARVKLAFEIDGESIATAEKLQSVITAQLPVSALALGKNNVEMKLLLDEKQLAAQKLQVVRLEPHSGCEVQADFIRGLVLKNKQPVFPVGIYGHSLQQRLGEDGCTDDEEYLFKFLAEDIGFDTLIRSKSSRNLAAYVRLAEKYGMDVVNWAYPPADTSMDRVQWNFRHYALEKLALPEHIQQAMQKDRNFWKGQNGSLNPADRVVFSRALYELAEPEVMEEAKLLRDSKNFLTYYNVDEPNLLDAENRILLAEWYWKTVYAVDPWHPQFLLFSAHIPHGDKWTKWGDILGFDIYPKLFRADAGIRIEPGLCTAHYAWQLRERCRQDNKIMWFVPISNIQDPCRTPIGMDKSRMLCQAYAAIIYGARGLFYFAFNNVVGQDAWDALRTICAQVKAMTPALLHGDIPQTIKYTPDDFDPPAQKFPMVNAAVFRYPAGDYLLMAVNIKPHAVDTRFSIDGIKSCKKLFVEDAISHKATNAQTELELADGAFQDKIEPYGVRAYRLQIAGAPAPVEIALEMAAVEDETARSVDLTALVRQVMMGRNYIPNPCFERQFLPGVPDFFRPYFNIMTDIDACKPGSSWFVDREVLWNGKPSLRVASLRWQESEKPSARGTFGAYYPPMSDKPQRLTFSFYARTTGTNATLLVRATSSDPAARQIVKLQPAPANEWRRYHMSFDQTPGNTANMGARSILLIPSEGAPVWISGLQMEAGDGPTEFQDDGVIAAKKAVAENPDNLIKNPGAEDGTADGWHGLENLRQGEFGARAGAGRSGEYSFCWRGQSGGINSDWIPVDTNLAYELTGSFKTESNTFSGLVFGLIMADAERKIIRPFQVFSETGTLTELVAPCRNGDRILRLKDASAWKTGGLFAAAFGAGENQYTANVTECGVEEVRLDGDAWLVVLKNPCGFDLPAGTPVVENRSGNGGIFLPASVKAEIGTNWVELKGRIGPQQWWPGTFYARAVITGPALRQAARKPQPPVLLLDDFCLRVVK